MYEEVSAEEFGLQQQAQDISKVIEHCEHFLALDSAHRLVFTMLCGKWYQNQMP